MSTISPASVPEGESPRPPERAVPLDDLAQQVRLLHQVAGAVEKYIKLRNDLQAAIKDRLGDAEVGTVAGKPAVSWKGTWRYAVSQKQLKERYPVIVPDVSEMTYVRTFRLLDPS